MQLNLVGPGSGESVTLTSGAGSIEYVASSVLTAIDAPPLCSSTFGLADTAEDSNSAYGPMSPSPSNVLQQTFSVNVGAAPERLRKGPRRPPTP
jgi:hypothetical protein